MFAVYGVTKMLALKKAEKDIAAGKGTLKEFSNDLYEYSEHLYKTMKSVKLTPIYPNLSEAKQFIELAKGQIRNPIIKHRIDTKDLLGDSMLDPKTNKVKLRWEIYKG